MTQDSRDDFSEETKRHLARSVNLNCSICHQPTGGPVTGGDKSMTTGHAAHICAAAPLGPRYDPAMTPEQRRHYDNGIWLCATHATLIDQDATAFPPEALRAMKRAAEERAAARLLRNQIEDDLRPSLDGPMEWQPPDPNETREGYAGLHHVTFMVGGKRKERGRVFIEVERDGRLHPRLDACMAQGTYSISNEVSALRPGQTYTIPVFNVVKRTTRFWLDKRFVPDHPFWEPPPLFTIQPGTYITDQPFLDLVHRPPLAAGRYRILAGVILGDAEHAETFKSAWKDVAVEARKPARNSDS